MLCDIDGLLRRDELSVCRTGVLAAGAEANELGMVRLCAFSTGAFERGVETSGSGVA